MAIKPPHSYVRYCTRHSRPPGRRYNVPRAGLALILFLLAAGGGRLRASKRSIAPFVSARVAALAHFGPLGTGLLCIGELHLHRGELCAS